jgi:putative ABC transport system ATP-binding protein
MPPLVVLERVAKRYRTGDTIVGALSRVSLTVDRGEFIAVMGPSGSGKSTLLSVLGCLERPSEGEYLLDGNNVLQLAPVQLAQLRNERIGFIFQTFNLLPTLTAIENVELPLFYRRQMLRSPRATAQRALERVGLNHRRNHFPAELSGGEQQRVAIARAIVNGPDLLLADEPTGALDTSTRDVILSLFAELHRAGLTVVIVTHDSEVGSWAQRAIRLRDGMVVVDDVRTLAEAAARCD